MPLILCSPWSWGEAFCAFERLSGKRITTYDEALKKIIPLLQQLK